MKERRKEIRVEEESRITLRLVSERKLPNGKKICYALTKDVSAGGVKILTDTLLPINTLLKIEFPLARAHKLVSVIGKVKWVKSLYNKELFEMGLEFVDTSPEDIMSLLEHIYKGKEENE